MANYCFWDLSIHVREIGFNACNLIKKLEEDPKANRVTIRGNIYDSVKIKFILQALKNTQVKILTFGHNSIKCLGAKTLADGLKYSSISCLNFYGCNIQSTGIKYLADNLKDTSITHLHISDNNIGDDGLKYLAEGLKNANVVSLDVSENGIKVDGIKYLANVLQHSNITLLKLDIRSNQIEDEGVKYLAESLKYSNITYLHINNNNISNFGIKYLADHLKDTYVTCLSFIGNNIDYNGFQYLVRILKDTQITKVEFDYNNIEFKEYKTGSKMITEAVSQTEKRTFKVLDTFKKLVALNTQTYGLEFVIPNEVKDLEMEDYLYIIKMISDNPKVKGHIFDMYVDMNVCFNYPNIIKKINEFILTMPNKFITFIHDKLPGLMELFASANYVNLVREFENMKMCEVVQNLLLHRVLYYVDKNSEILHPYIYKMLNKYDMPLYNDQLEPDKKEKIITFYQNHQEIDGAQEIIDLLVSECLQSDGN